MTDAVGQKNPSNQASEGKAPWEQVWNDLAHGLSIIGESMKDTFVPKAPPDAAPWERPWGATTADSPKRK